MRHDADRPPRVQIVRRAEVRGESCSPQEMTDQRAIGMCTQARGHASAARPDQYARSRGSIVRDMHEDV
jgi:hypothetical protein